VNQHFAINWRELEFKQFGETFEKSEILVERVLRSKDPLAVVTVSKSSLNCTQMRLKSSSVTIFDSKRNFLQICYKIKWQTHPETRHEHLVYAPGLNADDLKNMTHLRPDFSIDQLSFLVNETENSIDLVTGFMYGLEHFRSNQIITINRFNKTVKKWEGNIFFPEKYLNFHGCELYILHEPTRIIKLFQDLSKNLNYELFFFESFDYDKDLMIVDFVLKYCTNDHHFHGLCIMGYPIMIESWKFFAPPGEPYTAIERMFSPFEYEVWIFICVTLSTGIIVIQIMNRCTATVRNFVFGRGITTPTLNMAETFLCGAQVRTPGRNFARYNLMLFILWSLIIRTCYQSLLYKNLQADLRHSEASSFEDLVNRNFTFWMDSEKEASWVIETAVEESLTL